MADIGFELNYMHTFEIKDADGQWLRIGAGISNADPEGNEEIAQDAYYDGGGVPTSEVTGGQLVYSFEGSRRVGDPAQDYIASLLLSYGESRKSEFRWTLPDGGVLQDDCTIANIKPQGGDANAKSDFSFEIHLNGTPTYTPGNKTQLPESITASAVTVDVGETAAISATVTPTDASGKCYYAIGDEAIATVDVDGNVKGVAVGETAVTIRSAVRPEVSKQVTVTVSA